MSDQPNKNTKEENLPTFNVGAVVHLGVQQVSYEKIKEIIIGNERKIDEIYYDVLVPLYSSPLMVVTEVVKNAKDTFNEQTGLKQNNEKVNCMYFNFKTELYEERWFPADVLTEWQKLPEKYTAKRKGKVQDEDFVNYFTKKSNPIIIQTVEEIRDKAKNRHFLLKSSFEYLFRENGGLWKKRPNFDTPPMSLLDIVKEPNKPLNKYDQKTGDQIRWTTTHEERAKCIWFNPLTGKYSEGLFILEALQMIDITKPKPQ